MTHNYERLPGIPGLVADERYYIQHGVDPKNGEKEIVSVVDLTPGHDDEEITELEFVFRVESGVGVHIHTGVHRHKYGPGTHDECEHAPLDEFAVPGDVVSIAADRLDAPIASKAIADEDERQ